MKQLLAMLSALMMAGAAFADGSFVAHEWGTFTTIAGEDGAAMEWKPLAEQDDLPEFVYDLTDLSYGAGLRHNSRLKAGLSGLVRMETPVLYLYAQQEINVSVKVDFPEGTITEWYPRARTVQASIDWGRVRVLPGTTTNFPTEEAASHYYRARETDAATLRVCSDFGNEFEKFLFYRGVGSFAVPVKATLVDNRIRVTGNVGKVIVFENRAGRVGWTVTDAVCARSALDRPMDSLVPEFERMLTAQGLYEEEAHAMIATWRDSWFEEGLRVFYILPRQVTDQVLPLHLDPAPRDLVRVMVGRMELITPEMEREFREHPEAAKRKYGRFAEPILKQIHESEETAIF
jgi:hypothetical protein